MNKRFYSNLNPLFSLWAALWIFLQRETTQIANLSEHSWRHPGKNTMRSRVIVCHYGHLWCVVWCCLDTNYNLVHERARIFISSKYHIWILHKLVSDDVADRVILLIDSEYCSVWHLTLFKQFFSQFHIKFLPSCLAPSLSFSHRQIRGKTQMLEEHSYQRVRLYKIWSGGKRKHFASNMLVPVHDRGKAPN